MVYSNNENFENNEQFQATSNQWGSSQLETDIYIPIALVAHTVYQLIRYS